MDSTEQIDKEFSRIASLSDTQINLAEGALLIARAAYPNLEESLYLNQLDRIASRVKRDMAAELDAAGKIARINHVLYDVERFQGNREKYYDPNNSFLNRVLDRKTGIPITLSLIYIEVSRRLGLDVRGIGLPGHFIAALYHESEIIFIDPFNRGEIRSMDDCLDIVRTYTNETAAPDIDWLNPFSKKELLVRMLRNLKLIYARLENDIMLFKMIHWILTLQPEAPAELSARAMLYESMGNPDRAVKDWERYLACVGDHESVSKVRARIEDLRQQPSRIH